MSIRHRAQLENLQSLVCRRDLLKVGPLAISASVLPGLLSGSGHAAFAPSLTAKAKSVIFLWMGGGVTQLDSLDPKPEAPNKFAEHSLRFQHRCPEFSFLRSVRILHASRTNCAPSVRSRTTATIIC